MSDLYFPLEKFVGYPLDRDLKDNIRTKEKDGMYLYTYSDKVIVPRDHPVLVKCRGLVLDVNGKVLNYPFDRFFNPYEKESANIDWDTAEVQEKLDDSLICVFHYNDEWQVTTRGSFYPNPNADVNYEKLFRYYFHAFDELKENFCYIFGLVTDLNRIVTWYDDQFVVLLGIRNLETLLEVPQSVVDMAAKKFHVRRPKRYKATSVDECKALFSSLRDDEEGFVVVDLNFNRIKIKQDSYLALLRIKMLKDDDILDYVRGQIELDGELLQKDKDVLLRVDEIRCDWEELIEVLQMIFDGLDKSTRKAFALQALNYPFKKFLFQMLDNRDIKKVKLTYEELEGWVTPPVYWRSPK